MRSPTHLVGLKVRSLWEASLQVLTQLVGLVALLEHPADGLAHTEPGPAEVSLQDLAHIHTRGNAQRIQNDIHRSSILEVWHVLEW